MLADRLIKLAKRTPYFDLPGYMNRYWLVPPKRVIERRELEHDEDGRIVGEVTLVDNTGPVRFLERPFAWLLQRFDIAIRIHEILRSDRGRDPHDHPWPYLTIILKGYYVEYRFNDECEIKSAKKHGPGSVLFRRAHDLHLLIVDPGKTCTTLFIMGPKCQEWGFRKPDGRKIHWTEYTEQ